jgi:hypothetical protein
MSSSPFNSAARMAFSVAAAGLGRPSVFPSFLARANPEYPCAHCISSASLAGVIEVVFGTDEMPEVSIASPTAPGVVHHWTNIRAFSNEVSEARIWAGFHYRFSTRVGQDMGHKIGEYVAKNLMQPVAVVAR